MNQKICYYCVATNLGGAEKSLLELLRQLTETCELPKRALLPQGNGPLLAKLTAAGVPFDVIEMPRRFLSLSRETPVRSAVNLLLSLPGLARYVLRVRRYFRENNFRVVHTTGIKCHLLSWPATLGTGIPVVWHLRDILGRGLTRTALRALHALAGGKIRVIANSVATAQSFSRRRAPAVVYNGLDLNAYRGERETWNSTPVVAIVGVLAKWKGQREFLHMARELTDRGIDAQYWVVGAQIYDTGGDRGYADELRALAKSLGLGDRVEFLGFRSDISRVLERTDVLVHASTRPEPFGRVIVEAQACGVPVVASAAGGVLEIVEHDETGLLFPPGDVPAMARQVSRLLADEGLGRRLAESAQRNVEKEFCLARHAQKILHVYEEMGAP